MRKLPLRGAHSDQTASYNTVAPENRIVNHSSRHAANNDATRLAGYKELFPVIYTHSNVAGITLRGYEAGEVWLKGAELIAASGAARHALTWLQSCFAPVSNTIVVKAGEPNRSAWQVSRKNLPLHLNFTSSRL